MANKDKMSVEEMLAAARATDGGAPSADPPAAAADSPPAAETAGSEPTEEPVAPKPAAKNAAAMSVEEMMAAARSEKSGKSDSAGGGEAVAPAKPAAAKKKPGQMSVEEMMAAARGEKSPAKPSAKPAAAKATGAKPAGAKAAAKPAAAKSAAAKAGGPKDTASILAAARSTSKPGPISKAQAAAQGKTLPAGGKKKKLEVPPMPAKPAYAKAPASGSSQADRRGFLAMSLATLGVYLGSAAGIGFGTLIATNLLWLLGLARFMFPNILTEPPTKFKVGFPDELAPGQVATKFKAQFGVWIVRYEYDGVAQIFALQSVCTHLGCTPNWLEGEQKFKCPCHGSGFYKDGINFEGPAPRPLERFAIRLADDGQLEVDKSRKYKEEIGQWSDSASYVTV